MARLICYRISAIDIDVNQSNLIYVRLLQHEKFEREMSMPYAVGEE